jgi:CHAD domain-containing protein
VEWQYEAPALNDVIAWLQVARVPGYEVVPLKHKQVRDTYFDTADWRLFRGGFTCRVRHGDETSELTLKAMASAANGLRSRREMNELLGADVRRPEEATGPCGTAVRLMAGRRHVEALVTLDQSRTVFSLADGQGALGEITCDETVPGPGEPLHRVELEVVPGGVERAERFRALLVQVGALHPATLSKYEAALKAAGLEARPTETTLGSSEVRASMTTGEVAFAILRKHFAVFLANEPGTRLGEDIEALHDMRVAARRLRAAIQAFSPWLPARAQRFRAELGYIARVLGEVRDLDVFLETIDQWEREDPAHATALAAIAAVLGERRDAARTRMLGVLDRRRYDLFVERFAAWLRRGSPQSFLAGREPIVAVAPRLLAKRYRRFGKMGRAIGRASPPEDYHALRIEAKKLRYALEFVTPIYGTPAAAFARRLTALQDILGAHQDAYVAIDTLDGLATTFSRRLGPETLLAMGSVQERYRVRAAELRSSFPAAWKPLAGEWRGLQKSVSARSGA